jgi:hypothetical protein
MATKSAYKLPNSLKYRHYFVIVPCTDAGPFPFSLLAERYLCPHESGDASVLESLTYGEPKPLRLIQTSGVASLPPEKLAHGGWILVPIARDEAHFVFVKQNSLFDYNKKLSAQEMERNFGFRPAIAGSKYDEPLKYMHCAIVRPRGGGFRFPVDMLRYDRCYPYKVEDADLISKMTYELDPGPNAVRIITHSENSKPNWTDGRWHSFGWNVEPVAYSEFLSNA